MEKKISFTRILSSAYVTFHFVQMHRLRGEDMQYCIYCLKMIHDGGSWYACHSR